MVAVRPIHATRNAVPLGRLRTRCLAATGNHRSRYGQVPSPVPRMTPASPVGKQQDVLPAA
jgi:hypothetical protein